MCERCYENKARDVPYDLTEGIYKKWRDLTGTVKPTSSPSMDHTYNEASFAEIRSTKKVKLSDNAVVFSGKALASGAKRSI